MRAKEFIFEEIENIVVPPVIGPTPTSGVNLGGRNATSLDQVTHAYRNMSQEELSHARANGAFLPNPEPGRTPTWKPSQKYWSSGDAEGHFGRDWKNEKDSVKVRVPIDKVLPNTPVSINHAEVFDKATGKWSPVQPISSSATSRSTATSRMSTGGGSSGSSGRTHFGFGGNPGQSPSLDYPVN